MGLEELLDTQPHHLAVLFEKEKERRRRGDELQEFMMGNLIAMVANTGFKGWKEPRTPFEFMPSHWKDKPKEKRKRVDRKQVLQDTRTFFAAIRARQ